MAQVAPNRSSNAWFRAAYRQIRMEAERLAEEYPTTELASNEYKQRLFEVLQQTALVPVLTSGRGPLKKVDSHHVDQTIPPDLTYSPSIEEALNYLSPVEALRLLESPERDEINGRIFDMNGWAGGRGLYRIDELIGLIDAFVLHLQTNKKSLIDFGFPKRPFVNSYDLRRNLDNLYPVNISPSRRSERLAWFNDQSAGWIQERRPRIFTLKVRTLQKLASSMKSRQFNGIYSEIAELWTSLLTPEEIHNCLKIDLRYPLHSKITSGGLSNLIDFLHNCAQESIFGLCSKKREILDNSGLTIPSSRGQPIELKYDHYYEPKTAEERKILTDAITAIDLFNSDELWDKVLIFYDEFYGHLFQALRDRGLPASAWTEVNSRTRKRLVASPEEEELSAPTEKPPALLPFEHSIDFVSIKFPDRPLFSLTISQARFIEILAREYLKGTPVVGARTLHKKATGIGKRLKKGTRWTDLWEGNEVARDLLITEGPRKGTLKLRV